jgi:hypothetical protein
MRTRRRLTTWLGFGVVSALLAAMSGPARAQYGGLGAGWGWGMFGVQPSPSTTMLNQHALNRAAAGRTSTRSHSAYSNNPGAYFNRIRDNGFVSHYDVQRRRPPSYQTGRTTVSANREREAPQPAASAAAAAIAPLASFFDASLRLVWPQESPVDGEFREKRDISDRAALAVLTEKQQQGLASITSAAEARQRLVDYGRPALNQLRAVATPPIADSFHRFLLSLYDSLEASASPPEAVAGARP